MDDVDLGPEGEACVESMLDVYPQDYGDPAEPGYEERIVDAWCGRYPPDYGHPEGDDWMPKKRERPEWAESWPAKFLAAQVAGGVDCRPWFLSVDWGPCWVSSADMRMKLLWLQRDCLAGCAGLYSISVVLPDDQVQRSLPRCNVGHGVVHRASVMLFSFGPLDEAELARAWSKRKGRALVLRPVPVDGGVRAWAPSDGVERAREGLALAMARVLGVGFNAPGRGVRVIPFNAPYADLWQLGDVSLVARSAAVPLAEQP